MYKMIGKNSTCTYYVHDKMHTQLGLPNLNHGHRLGLNSVIHGALTLFPPEGWGDGLYTYLY